MIYLYIQNFHFKDSFWRSDHKSQFSTTRFVRKFIHSLLSLDPDPLHAVTAQGYSFSPKNQKQASRYHIRITSLRSFERMV